MHTLKELLMGAMMEDTMSLATLARELQELESETFELHDYVQDVDMLINSCSTSSCSSTTSSTCA
jgi:thiazolylpeptide-type bacteriocin precursor